MFIMVAAWHRTNPELSPARRMAETLQEAAVAITITSITDIVSWSVLLLILIEKWSYRKSYYISKNIDPGSNRVHRMIAIQWDNFCLKFYFPNFRQRSFDLIIAFLIKSLHLILDNICYRNVYPIAGSEDVLSLHLPPSHFHLHLSTIVWLFLKLWNFPLILGFSLPYWPMRLKWRTKENIPFSLEKPSNHHKQVGAQYMIIHQEQFRCKLEIVFSGGIRVSKGNIPEEGFHQIAYRWGGEISGKRMDE